MKDNKNLRILGKVYTVVKQSSLADANNSQSVLKIRETGTREENLVPFQVFVRFLRHY